MSSLESCYEYTFYRPGNKSWICVITVEVGMQYVPYLYQLIVNRGHNIKYTINTDRLTGVYFTDWSVNYWK